MPRGSSPCRSATSPRRPDGPRETRRPRTRGSTRPGPRSDVTIVPGGAANSAAPRLRVRAPRTNLSAMQRRFCAGFILGAGMGLLAVAHAGHEFPFYPSFFPQEITVEALDAQTAAQRLGAGTLHAYAGGDLPTPVDSAKIGTITALGGYVVATFAGRADPAARCAKARALKAALGEG